MSHRLCFALILCHAAPGIAHSQSAAEFTMAASRACADQLFSRAEVVMQAANKVQFVALDPGFGRKTPDATTRESAARAIGAGIAEIQRLRTALAALEAPDSAARDWEALLGVIAVNIRLAESREAVLPGKTETVLRAIGSF